MLKNIRVFLLKIKKIILNPRLLLCFLLCRFGSMFPDKHYLFLMYLLRMNKLLNLKSPKTFNEKLQWLKLYDRRPEYTIYADKYAVREHIANTIGEDYLIPLLGVWDKVEDVPWNKLPNQFVLKCNHGSAMNIICTDKSKFDIDEAKIKLKKWLGQNHYYYGREWAYKNIKPKIICEKYMVDESGYELKDYKFFCFNGEVNSLFIATERSSDVKCDFFDPDFNHLPIKRGHENSTNHINKPRSFELMKSLAKSLSNTIPHVRVDFYEIDGKIYFGEMTFYPAAGYAKFKPPEYDIVFGDWINLPEKHKSRE